MTQEETRSPDLRGSAACRDDLLVLCGGAGVCNASLITIMASADAFAARLAASSQHAAELSTLQLRQLATSLAEMQPMRAARGADMGVRAVSQTHAQGAVAHVRRARRHLSI